MLAFFSAPVLTSFVSCSPLRGLNQAGNSLPRQNSRFTALHPCSRPTRRAVLRLLCLFPLAARPPLHAQTTITPPSVAVNIEEALSIRRAFSSLLPLLNSGEYDAFRMSLRAPPLSRCRTSLSALAMKLPNELDRNRGRRAYQELISGIEKIDVLALKASRGSKGDGVLQQFDKTMALFDKFVEGLSGS